MRKSSVRRSPRRVIGVFLGYQFQSKYFQRSDMLASIEAAVRLAEEDLSNHWPGIRLEMIHEASHPGVALSRQIIDMVRDAAVGIFEVSDNNGNVFFELGLAYGTGKTEPIILVNRGATSKIKIPSDIREFFRLEYQNKRIASIKATIAQHIRIQVDRKLKQESRADTWHDLKAVWAGNNRIRNVTVVCPELPRNYRPRYAHPDSPEYVNLARFGDADALVELLAVLPKLFPDSEVKHITAGEMQRHDLSGNLIVIGGPDFNPITRKLFADQDIPFTYCSSESAVYFKDSTDGAKYELVANKQGRVHKDYGFFARFPNPLNTGNFIIMIGGLQTYGVLGAVRLFGMNAAGRRNAKTVLSRCSGNPKFCALTPIRVVDSQPTLGHLDRAAIRTYPWH